MTRFISFIKTTAIGGLLVIVPIAIILAVLAQIFFGLYTLAGDVTEALKIEIDDAVVMVGIAALALIGLCFATGLLVQTRLGTVLKDWFYRNLGRRIPMFGAISNITRRFVGMESMTFAPVEIDLYDSDARALGFLIETLPNQRCAVFVPSAPVATVGNLYVIAGDKVTPIEASMADTVSVITHWGVDAGDLYREDKEAGAGDDSVTA